MNPDEEMAERMAAMAERRARAAAAAAARATPAPLTHLYGHFDIAATWKHQQSSSLTSTSQGHATLPPSRCVPCSSVPMLRMLIGACNPMLCPMHVFRQQQTATNTEVTATTVATTPLEEERQRERYALPMPRSMPCRRARLTATVPSPLSVGARHGLPYLYSRTRHLPSPMASPLLPPRCPLSCFPAGRRGRPGKPMRTTSGPRRSR